MGNGWGDFGTGAMAGRNAYQEDEMLRREKAAAEQARGDEQNKMLNENMRQLAVAFAQQNRLGKGNDFNIPGAGSFGITEKPARETTAADDRLAWEKSPEKQADDASYKIADSAAKAWNNSLRGKMSPWDETRIYEAKQKAKKLLLAGYSEEQAQALLESESGGGFDLTQPLLSGQNVSSALGALTSPQGGVQPGQDIYQSVTPGVGIGASMQAPKNFFSAKRQAFASEAEAEKANLPKGTKITIGGKNVTVR